MTPFRKTLLVLVVILLLVWAASSPSSAATAVSSVGTGIVNVANAIIQGFSHIKFGGSQ